MSLPDNFPAKEALEKEGYRSIEDVSEATDDELKEIEGIGDATVAKIREEAPYKMSSDEIGIGATSKGSVDSKTPSGSMDPNSSVSLKSDIKDFQG
jgi:hypothetical protein